MQIMKPKPPQPITEAATIAGLVIGGPVGGAVGAAVGQMADKVNEPPDLLVQPPSPKIPDVPGSNGSNAITRRLDTMTQEAENKPFPQNSPATATQTISDPTANPTSSAVKPTFDIDQIMKAKALFNSTS